MKKISLLVLVCMLASMMLALTSCLPGDVHTHDYGTDWIIDATNHYHRCVCGEKSDVAAHVDADNSGACDVCSIAMAKQSEEHTHADADNDGACDTCAAIMDAEHVYDSKFEYDDTHHWHKAICGHDLTTEKVAHTEGVLGLCECGFAMSTVDVSNLAKAIAAAKLAQSAGFINNGVYRSASNDGALDVSNYYYVGNMLHIFELSGNYNAHYYYTPGDDGVTLIKVTNDIYNPTSKTEGLEDTYMYGPVVPASGILGDYETTYYGPADLLEQLYALAVANPQNNFYQEIYEDGSYNFSYSFADVESYYKTYYDISVSFTLDPDKYYIDSLTVRSEQYDMQEEVPVLDENGDPVYGWNGIQTELVDVYTSETVGEGDDAKVIYTFNEGKKILGRYVTVSFDQYIDAPENYTPENAIPTDFDFVDEDGNVIDFTTGVTYEGGNAYSIVIGNIAPATGIAGLVNIEFTLLDASGSNSWYGNYEGGVLSISEYAKVGTYTAYIVVDGDMDNPIQFPVNVTYKATTEIGASVNGSAAAVTEANVYTGSEVTIAGIAGEYEDPSITAELKGDNAANATLTKADDGTYTFTSDVAGTYTVEIKSAANTELAAVTLTITVEETPDVNEMVSAAGKYSVVTDEEFGEVVELTFDSANNTATLYSNYWAGNYNGTFTYTVVDGVFTATYVSGDFETLVLNGDYQFVAGLTYYGSVMEFALDTFTANSSDPEGPAATPITGGADKATAVEITAAGTYSVTVGAGESVYFMETYVDTAYFVSVTFTGDVTATYAAGKMQMPLVQGFTLEPGMPPVAFWFTNNTDAAVEVVFTVAYEAM